MITYKITNYPKFEEAHKDFFNSLLQELIDAGFLSLKINEIVITDNIDLEIENYCKIRFRTPTITRSREFTSVAKTIDFEGKKKVFFDAINVNIYIERSRQVFFEQLIEVYAEDIVSENYSFPSSYSFDTPFREVIGIYFSQWAVKVVANDIEKKLGFPQQKVLTDVKMFVDTFKRNIRQAHYKYQKDLLLHDFWKSVVYEFDFFIRRCFDVKYDDGSFTDLQEFSAIIPSLLSEIENQTQNLLNKTEIDLSAIIKDVREILNKCSVDVSLDEKLIVNILGTPKKLFKDSIVDTEPRIVAFLDILGFSAIIEEYDSDSQSNLLNELHETLELAMKISIDGILKDNYNTDIKEHLTYRMFSDCICISLPYIEFGNDFHVQFNSLATILNTYQLAMMQKGFFVRGGIAVGSFYSDKYMVFSGGLVSAYKLEQKAVYPIIVVENKVIERLKVDYLKNTEGLFFEHLLLYSDHEPERIFLNPFDTLDNSKTNLKILQTEMNKIVDEVDKNKCDPSSVFISSFAKIAESLTKPIFDSVDVLMTPENINAAKNRVLSFCNDQIIKQNEILLKSEIDSQKHKEANRIIQKYDYLKSLIEWSMNKADSDLFKYYQLS